MEPEADNEKEIMSLREVAEFLRCNRSTIYRLLKRREIPGFKVGGDWRFSRSEIVAWINRRTSESLATQGRSKKSSEREPHTH
jgi:excisionase family DNA binding protein